MAYSIIHSILYTFSHLTRTEQAFIGVELMIEAMAFTLTVRRNRRNFNPW
ncbi:MAG: hypothetical protein KGI54_14705 [Pseudomonadota bacterium]|nr:hypothetical protein [Pseudomonadota bacterium]